MYTENLCNSIKITEFEYIVHTEQEIDTYHYMDGCISGNKTGFVRPGHIYSYNCTTQCSYNINIDIHIF